METFGKTGCRRIVPGQYLAADPQGRAIMISAVEKQKLVGGVLALMFVLLVESLRYIAKISRDAS